MQTILILAGLSPQVFERVRSVSAKRFVPHGHLVRSPRKERSYTDDYAQRLIRMAHDFLMGEPEEEQVSVILAYVDDPNAGTRQFIESFFPFALPVALEPFHVERNSSNNAFNRAMNDYVEHLLEESRRALEVSAVVRKHTNIQNLTPLLLPVRNFASAYLMTLLENLFWKLGSDPSPDDLIKQETKQFVARVPLVYPPDADRHCFSDAVLFFKSPGKHRHGFYRHSPTNQHELQCLLNARSRLGGTFDYKFHYDCTPLKGGVAATYPNCHDHPSWPSKHTHVNIAPNDYIV